MRTHEVEIPFHQQLSAAEALAVIPTRDLVSAFYVATTPGQTTTVRPNPLDKYVQSNVPQNFLLSALGVRAEDNEIPLPDLETIRFTSSLLADPASGNPISPYRESFADLARRCMNSENRLKAQGGK